ncbi:uncharacterized protein LTR77_005058 [Saxophila tyrrhenica]|uniref:Peptidase A1 domain-containing protein n=1 Tax=Saxophila tyrrhenica TaxID=1690608 RepID=A0AAV9PBM0_9PEZI|nr:hypothetical protein LTR77_005058 [Saxophila tyrrhenica]
MKGLKLRACAVQPLGLLMLTFASLSTALSLPSWPRPTSLRGSDLQRRQRSNSSTPSAISIAPSQYWEGNDGPWSTFPLQIGSGSVGGLQNVRVLVSTAATAIWTIGAEGCPNGYVNSCPDSRGGLFLRNQSLTWAPDSIFQTGLEMNLGLDSSGYVGFDVATLGWQGSGAEVTDQHATVWNMADPRYWIGVFGMNPRPTNLSDFNDPQTSFMQKLFESKKIPSVSYGYTAGNQYRADGYYGSLTLGGYDPNRFVENDVSFPFDEDISRDLSVNLHSITTSTGLPSDLLPDGSISIFIDSTVPEIWLPESACNAFESAFGLTYNTSIGRYLVSSSTRQRLLSENPDVTFTIGPINGGSKGKTVDITLPYRAFDLHLSFPIIPNDYNGTTHYFPLQRAANDTQYTLGRTFLQEAYLIADYEHQNFSISQCDWSQKAAGNDQDVVSIISPQLKASQSSSNPDSDSSLSAGAIAGVAIGVVALIAVLGAALVFIRRRKKADKKRAAELEAKENFADEDSAEPKVGPISEPIGGELGGGEIHEAPLTQMRPEMESGRDGVEKYGYSEMDGRGHVIEMDGKGYTAEMPGSAAVLEMPGSEGRVFERDLKRGARPPPDEKSEGGWI